jgi:hypothetical protein
VADRDVIGQTFGEPVHEGERVARTVGELVSDDDGALLGNQLDGGSGIQNFLLNQGPSEFPKVTTRTESW